MAAAKHVAKKFDGDDSYSWAVFRAADVKGLRGIVFYGQARPVMSGMSRAEAQRVAKRLSGGSR